jgi:hypothetical protein
MSLENRGSRPRFPANFFFSENSGGIAVSQYLENLGGDTARPRIKNLTSPIFDIAPPQRISESCYEYQKMGLIKKWDLRASQKPQHTPQKTPKMAEPRPYDPLLHGFIWPLLGQKSSHKKCYRTEIIATSARVIWPRAVALPDGFTIPWLPSCTADDLLHHEQKAGK